MSLGGLAKYDRAVGFCSRCLSWSKILTRISLLCLHASFSEILDALESRLPVIRFVRLERLTFLTLLFDACVAAAVKLA